MEVVGDFSGTFYPSFLFFSFIYLFIWERERCHDSCLRFKSVLCLIWGNFQVEVEALVIQGPKLGTVMSQVKKLEASVLVLGQKRPSTLISWWVLHSLTFISQNNVFSAL